MFPRTRAPAGAHDVALLTCHACYLVVPVFGTIGAWVGWYRGMYYGLSRNASCRFLCFFIMFAAHVCFAICAAVGVPATAGCITLIDGAPACLPARRVALWSRCRVVRRCCVIAHHLAHVFVAGAVAANWTGTSHSYGFQIFLVAVSFSLWSVIAIASAILLKRVRWRCVSCIGAVGVAWACRVWHARRKACQRGPVSPPGVRRIWLHQFHAQYKSKGQASFQDVKSGAATGAYTRTTRVASSPTHPGLTVSRWFDARLLAPAAAALNGATQVAKTEAFQDAAAGAARAAVTQSLKQPQPNQLTTAGGGNPFGV